MGMATTAATSPRQTITVIDNRTGKSYEFPITHNSIKAVDFKKVSSQR
jgi:citrate synthase